VTFYDGVQVLGESAVSAGKAVLATHVLSTGARSLRAYFSGAGFSPSNGTTTQTVNSVASASLLTRAGYSVGDSPYSVALGDFNHDGNMDLAVGDYAGALLIQLGNGDGTFQAPVSYTLSSIRSPSYVAVADLNGDGFSDVVVTSFAGVSVYLGSASGTLLLAQSYQISNIEPVVIADFNGDGNSDFAVAGASLEIFLGNGAGGFTQLPTQAALPVNFPDSMVGGDFNHDGKADLALLNYPTHTIEILLGNGDGTFNAFASYQTTSFPGAITTADLRGHGTLDLVVATADSSVSVMLGNGDGSFQTGVAYPAGPETIGVSVIDINGDGEPDLAVANNYGGNAVLFGNGDGTFQSAVFYAAVQPVAHPMALAAADFNGDGRVDLAVAGPGGVSTLQGQAAAGPTLQVQSVTPSSGTGVAQVFSFNFSDSAGSADIASLTLGFGGGTSNLASGCGIVYNRAANTLSVLDNFSNITPAETAAVGAFQTIGNTQCAVDTSQSGITGGSGTDLQFSVMVGFEQAGYLSIRAEAVSATGVSTSWQQAGSWNDPDSAGSPAALAVSPASGTGLAQTFTFTFNDPNGPADVDSVVVLVGNLNSGADCWVQLQPYSSRVWVRNDADAGFVGSATLGAPVVLQNSQCALNVAASSASWSGNTLTFSVPLTFSVSFAGIQTIWAGVSPLSKINSGTATLGTWTVGNPPPTLIGTSPSGLQFSVDGQGAQTAPQSLSLSTGPHTIAVTSPQAGTPGTQYVFTGWSDSGGANHTITVTTTSATYTANFKTQYQLTTSALPASGGTVTPATGFYDSGTQLPVSSSAISPYQFLGWTGGASGIAVPAVITLNGPLSVDAVFGVPGFTCSVLSGALIPTVADVQQVVNETLGTAVPLDDLNGDHSVNLIDVQKVVDAAIGLGCLY
jgi:hypothetical protein